MDFSFINELALVLSKNNIFRFTFTGSKIFAFALLSFRVLEAYIKGFDEKEPKIGNLINLFGYGLVIMSSDWIMTTIDNIFAGVDVMMGNTSSDLFITLAERINEKWVSIFDEAEDFFDYIGMFVDNFLNIMSLVIVLILGALCKLADLSITASYLVQRIIIMKLLVVLFPLAVALSTYSGTQKLFHTWILRYIGIFILGIAYIGIVNGAEIIQNVLLNQFDIGGSAENVGIFSIGTIVAMITAFTIKVKLFSSVTSYVMGMFQ